MVAERSYCSSPHCVARGGSEWVGICHDDYLPPAVEARPGNRHDAVEVAGVPKRATAPRRVGSDSEAVVAAYCVHGAKLLRS
jgi:hypothetical protein